MKRLLLIFGILSFSISWGQDLHLSQFYTSDLFLNPAFAGKYNGDYRVVINHRNQWRQIGGAIVTNMASVEKRFERYNDGLNIGLLVTNDQVEFIGLQNNGFFLTGAYEKVIGLNLFRVGLQVGMNFKKVDFSNQTFPEQWDYSTGEFNQTLSSGENSLNQNKNYLDMNIGLGWTRRLRFGKLEAGYALNHFNKPNYGFIKKEKLAFRHTFNSTLSVRLTDNITLEPYVFLATTTGVQNMILGNNISYQLNEIWDVFAGVSFRKSFAFNDAMIGMVGLGYNRFEFRLSNDYTISTLNQSGNNKSSFELSLIYTSPSTTPNKITIPCERY